MVGTPALNIMFDAQNTIQNWKNYRWRVLKLTERPIGRGAF